MTRSMVGGGIGSMRQDYLIHCSLMIGRRLTKGDVKQIDSMRRDGSTVIACAEAIALETGEALTYPKARAVLATIDGKQS